MARRDGNTDLLTHDGEIPLKIEGRPIHIASTPFKLTEQDMIKGRYGPPPWSLRLRRIEDWHAAAKAHLASSWEEIRREFGSQDARQRALSRAVDQLNIAEVNDLIERHNAYFPIEARLPIDSITGELLHGGKPWSPMAPVTRGGLIAEVEAELMG